MIRWISFAFLGSALMLSFHERDGFRALSGREAAAVIGSGDPPLPANWECVNLPVGPRCNQVYGSGFPYTCTSQQTPCTLCTPTFGATYRQCVQGGKGCDRNTSGATECGPKFEGTCVTQPWGWGCIGSPQGGDCGSIDHQCRIP